MNTKFRNTQEAEHYLLEHFAGLERCVLCGCDTQVVEEMIDQLLRLRGHFSEAAARIERIEASVFDEEPVVEVLRRYGITRMDADGAVIRQNAPAESSGILPYLVPRPCDYACYVASERLIRLNTTYLGDHGTLCRSLSLTEDYGLIPKLQTFSNFPVLHSFAHVLVEWIQELDVMVESDDESVISAADLLRGEVELCKTYLPCWGIVPMGLNDAFAYSFVWFHDGYHGTWSDAAMMIGGCAGRIVDDMDWQNHLNTWVRKRRAGPKPDSCD